MYKESVLLDLLSFKYDYDENKIKYAFYESLTKDDYNNLLPIYNFIIFLLILLPK